MMKKRMVSLLLTLCLIVGLLPGTVLATDADKITVYISVVQDGTFVTDKDGNAVACAPVTIDSDDPTIGDAFTALHEMYFLGGVDGYETAEVYTASNPMVKKFWGIESSSIGYYNNNEYAMGTADAVSPRAHLVFWFYQDTSSWSDIYTYTYFNQTTVSISGGAALELTLTSAGWSGPEPLSGASITVDGEKTNYTTDANGIATIYFPKAGSYIVSAGVDSGYIVPPVCIVTVTGDDENAAQIVSEDKDALTLPESITENLSLPAVGNSGKSSIVWSTSDASVISADGVVTRSGEDKWATLTATLTYGDYTDKKEFTISVPKLTDAELVAAAKTALETASIVPNQWNDDFTDAGDTNIVTVAQRIIVDAAVSGVAVNTTVSSNDTSSIAADGTITYGNRSRDVSVTFTISKGGETATVTASVTVPQRTVTRQSVMDSATEELLKESILKSNSSLDNVTSDLNLPTSLSDILDDYINGMMLQASWTIPEEYASYLDRYGSVTRPAYLKGNVTFDLTCTLSWYSAMDPYMGNSFVGPVPEEKTLTFSVTIEAITQEEYNAGKTAVDAALDAFESSSITDFYDGSEIDLAVVTTTALMLPSVSGFNTVWTTKDSAVIEAPLYNTGKAVVHRPSPGSSDVTCTVVLSLSQNGYSATKEIPITVKAITQEEVDNETAYLDAIKQALSFQTIRKDNLLASNVTGSLQMVYRGIYDSETDAVTWSTTNRGYDGIEITWTTSDSSVVASYGTVTRPAADTDVTLTATLTSIRLSEYVPSQTVEIPVTVLGREKSALDNLLENIAAGYVDSSSEWVVMDMAAYADYVDAASYVTSETAKQAYLNATITALQADSVSDTTYSKAILGLTSIGADAQLLYPVNGDDPIDAVAGLNSVTQSTSAWSAPYILAAYNQSDYEGTESYETALVNALLAAQKDDGSWDEFGTIDTTANAIAGLSFYADDPDVAAAIEKGVNYLASQMKDDGTFDGGYGSNANSCAMVIIGLCAAGVNPDTDTRFVKDDVSALDGLLSFALSDNSGFGYMNNAAFNANATEQGFRALIAAAQVIATGKAYNVYDFSHNADTLQPGYATDGTGSTETPVTPPTGQSITVSFTLTGDSVHGDRAHTAYETWISRSISVPAGSTVGNVLSSALSSAGYTAVGIDTGYVTSITTPDGVTLAAFSNGANSGWMFRVNGEIPAVGINDCVLANGDIVELFFIDDWQTLYEGTGTGGTGSVEADSGFVDVDGHWAEAEILWAVEQGLFEGVTEDTFAPNLATTRGTVATVLYRMAGSPDVTSASSFSDVSAGTWCADAIAWAAENSVALGYAGGAFLPSQAVTRQQFIVMLYRYAQVMGYDTTLGGMAIREFDDCGTVSDYALDAMTWAVNNGLILGSGSNLYPRANLTRAQAVVICQRFCEAFAGN